MYLLSLFPVNLSLQQFVLIVNSMVLIGLLIAVELWSTSEENKNKAKLYYPLIIIYLILIAYAGYVQLGGKL